MTLLLRHDYDTWEYPVPNVISIRHKTSQSVLVFEQVFRPITELYIQNNRRSYSHNRSKLAVLIT